MFKSKIQKVIIKCEECGHENLYTVELKGRCDFCTASQVKTYALADGLQMCEQCRECAKCLSEKSAVVRKILGGLD